MAIVGRDPRASGEMLEAAVIAGLTSEGVDVLRVGVLPTPAVAHLTDAYDAEFGVMISASHNPMPDNGIKIFGRGGHKLDDATEDRIEDLVNMGPGSRPAGADIGRVRDADDALDRYLRHVAGAVTTPARGLTVVVDCAHGAASAAAPLAYRAAGANVVAINAEPNGLNINDGCGSTHLDVLQRAVLAHGADLGLAHDGDADRCLAVDANGRIVDGDAIMVVLALAMRDAGELASDTLVATVMSNLGLHIAMRAAGIEVRTTSVGDRYVLEELHAGGYSLGGEQSGHIVMPSFGTTGDGIVTGLRLMSRMAQTGLPLAALAEPMHTLAAGADQRRRCRQGDRRRGALGAHCGRRSRGRTGRLGSNPVAAVGNRTGGPRHGGGRRRGHRADPGDAGRGLRQFTGLIGRNQPGDWRVLPSMGEPDAARVDMGVLLDVAGRYDAVADALDGVARTHLARLDLRWRRRGPRACRARGRRCALPLMRSAGTFARGPAPEVEIASAIRVSVDHYLAAEARGTTRLG